MTPDHLQQLDIFAGVICLFCMGLALWANIRAGSLESRLSKLEAKPEEEPPKPEKKGANISIRVKFGPARIFRATRILYPDDGRLIIYFNETVSAVYAKDVWECAEVLRPEEKAPEEKS